MTESHMRLRRVKLKAGGEIHVLHNRPAPDGDMDWRGKIVENARAIADTATEKAPLTGYLVIGMFKDGAHSCGLRIDDDNNPIPTTLLPAFVEEIVRRYTVTKVQAGDTFHEIFEWRDGA